MYWLWVFVFDSCWISSSSSLPVSYSVVQYRCVVKLDVVVEHVKLRTLPAFSMQFHLIARYFLAAYHCYAIQDKGFDEVLSPKHIPLFFFVLCSLVDDILCAVCRPVIIQLLRIHFSLHLAEFHYCHNKSQRFLSDSNRLRTPYLRVLKTNVLYECMSLHIYVF